MANIANEPLAHPTAVEGSTTSADASGDAITERVRERYAQAAQRVQSGGDASGGCCGGECGCGDQSGDVVTSGLYDDEQVAGLPEEAVVASLGCGNPTALIDLREGETVLDLGSGGGIDVLLSARRVGPTGFAYGVDMTDEMLALAQENKRRQASPTSRFCAGVSRRFRCQRTP